MIFSIVTLSLLCLILAGCLTWSVRLNLKYAEKFEEIIDQIDVSLDILDTQYQRAAAKAELEVLSDEPVVRDLIDDIKSSRDAILLVANLIVEPTQDEEKGLRWHQEKQKSQLTKKQKKKKKK